MFELLLKKLIIPLSVEAVKKYVKSTDSTKDDKVLEIVKTGATYLANKPNNNLSTGIATAVNDSEMKRIQG